MPTATLTSKGQITLPQAVRASLGLDIGDKLDFIADQTGGFSIIALRKDASILRGRFAGRARVPISVEDMNAAIADEASARTARAGAKLRSARRT